MLVNKHRSPEKKLSSSLNNQISEVSQNLLDMPKQTNGVGNMNEDLSAQVLVVEDNLYAAMALITILEQYSLKCNMVSGGLESVNLVKQRYQKDQSSYEIIIMDLYLPEIDGFKATEQILEFLEGRLQKDKIPYFCLLTQNNRQSCAQRALEMGFRKVLQKPIFKSGV